MDKQSKKQDKQYQIPMVVTDEVIHDFGIKQVSIPPETEHLDRTN